MTKIKHPKGRGERLRIKYKKEKLNHFDREALERRHQLEALEQKEALDDLRKQVLQTEEEERPNN